MWGFRDGQLVRVVKARESVELIWPLVFNYLFQLIIYHDDVGFTGAPYTKG
jgi:hypothetical protein